MTILIFAPINSTLSRISKRGEKHDEKRIVFTITKKRGVSMDRDKKEPCGGTAQDEITEAKEIILKAKRLTKINKILTGLNLLIFLGYLAKFL